MNEDLPEGWTSARPDQLAAQRRSALTIGPFGSNLKVADYRDAGVPLVFVREIRAERFGGAKTRFVSHEKASELAPHSVDPGDLLVTKMGEPPGDTAVYPLDRPAAIITADCIKLSPNTGVTSANYLRLVLRALPVRSQILEQTMGVAQQKLSLERFRTIEVPLPPLTEQRRIVEKVEALLARVDAARDRLAKVPTILKRFRQSVLAAACSGRLTEDWRAKTKVEPLDRTLSRVDFVQTSTGREATEDVTPGDCILSVGDPGSEVPEGWRWLPLREVARLESGHTPSRKHPEYWTGTIPWIGILDAGKHHGGAIAETLQHVAQSGLDNSAARLLPKGTVCLSRTASVGYVVIMGKPMATSQDFVNWVCSEALDPNFLMFALMAEGDGIKRFGRGSTHTTIYFPEVKALHICLPPLAEQREIVSRIRALLPLADTLADRVLDASSQVRKLTQAVLAKAFHGELVPTEAELARREKRDYEPAEKLLERIKALANDVAAPRRKRGKKASPPKKIRRGA